jgi:IS1 family transposase
MPDCGRYETWRRCLGWAAGENVGNLIVGGEKPLHLTRRLEALHDPLSSARRLVGILRSVIEAFVLAPLDAGHDHPLGSRIAFQLVGDQHTGLSSLLLQQFTEQALGGRLIAPALDEDVENEALLVSLAPEPMLRAGEGDDDLIEVPCVTMTRHSPTDARGKFATGRPRPTDRWHMDEMVVTIAGKRFWLWRTVDSEGEVLDLLVQSRRNTAAALRLMRKLLRKQCFAPETIATDKLRSYGAAIRELGLSMRHEQGRRQNNRAEKSHRPTRLGRVDVHRHLVLMTVAARQIIAAKLVSVLQALMAILLNFFNFWKQFSTRCRHLYISSSWGAGSSRPFLAGITASIPLLSKWALVHE